MSIEHEHKVYWAIKAFNLNLKNASNERKLQLNKLDSYENIKIFKVKSKTFYDSRISRKIFKID